MKETKQKQTLIDSDCGHLSVKKLSQFHSVESQENIKVFIIF